MSVRYPHAKLHSTKVAVPSLQVRPCSFAGQEVMHSNSCYCLFPSNPIEIPQRHLESGFQGDWMALLQRKISIQGAAKLEMYVIGTCIPYLTLVINLI
jgi:hypothetical protein